MRNIVRITVFVGVIGISFSNAVEADVINVPTDQQTIQDAINAASPGDEVVVAPGTYSEIIDLIGKAITVRSSGGAAVTTIDATNVVDPGTGKPVIRCDSGEGPDTVIDGFTVTGGTGDTTWFGAGSAGGGGMFINGTTPTVTHCIFSGNSSKFGGAFYIDNADGVTVSHSRFGGNSATNSGGGIYSFESSLMLTTCRFYGNTAQFNGGGLYSLESSATVLNSTFTGNTATNNGGGVWSFRGSAKVANCTFGSNTATDSGGGMYSHDNHSEISNCILWGNADTGGMDESAQIHTSGGTAVVDYSDIQGGWTGAGGRGNINADPMFVDANGADDVLGTDDDNLRLSDGSPCIDEGNNYGSKLTDLDGSARIVNCTVDMGAYENQNAGIPSVQGLIHNITQNVFLGSLQEAIDGSSDDDVIEAMPCRYREIIDFHGRAITLRSTDPTNPAVVAATIIDATNVVDPGTGKPVIRCQSEEGPDTILDGFTITGGTGDTSILNGHAIGGGMINYSASPTVKNCTFIGNSAANGGGGMRNIGSSAIVTNCAFIANHAVAGGGMLNGGSNPTVAGCKFIGNSAGKFFGGGGIFNWLSSSPTLINVTFSGNTAESGGGMYSEGQSNPQIIGSIFWGNSDSGGMDESGQIHTIEGTTSVSYSNVQGGWTGLGVTGNINADPMFVDADGADDVLGTADDDVRLSAGSPCIDAGHTLPLAVTGIQHDLDGNARAVDDPTTPDTGTSLLGLGVVVDMGAYEYHGATTIGMADLDHDGDVDLDDFALFMQQFIGPF